MSRLSGAIASFNPRTLTVTRTVAGRIVRGWYVAAPELDDDVVLNGVTDEVLLVGHGLLTGDGPVLVRTTGVLPTGLSTSTYYWVIRVDDDTVKLAASYAAAIGLTAVSFGINGSGQAGLVQPKTFPIVAGVQSAGGRDDSYLPAGVHGEETLVLYTETLLHGVAPESGAVPTHEPDTVAITWLGATEDWLVTKVEQFDNISGHYRAYVTRLGLP